jgi:chemotaxis protein CheC
VRAALSPLELTPQQVEALRQLANLGAKDATASLSRLLGAAVESGQTRAQVAPRGGVERVLQPEPAAFSCHFTVEGGARMRWMMQVSPDGAQLMGGLLLGSPHFRNRPQGGDMHASALAEMANIVVSSYVGGVAAAAGLTLVPSIPYVGKGSVSETLDAAFGDLDSALLLVTDLRLPGVRNAGRLVAAPVDESLARLLSMLGAA